MVREIQRGAGRAEVLVAKRERVNEAMIASAADLTRNGSGFVSNKKAAKSQSWQRTAWNFRDTITEFHYGVEWVGNLLSKAMLHPLKDGKPCEEGDPAIQIMTDFYGGPDQHGEYLRQAGIHMTVPGEFYLVGWEDEGEDVWRVIASTRIRKEGIGPDAKWTLTDEPDVSPTFVMRSWRPHPENSRLADSPTRAALPVLSEISVLTKHVSSQADSRLTGSGLLLLPSQVTFATTPAANGQVATQDSATPDAFVKMLGEMMTAAVQNPETAAARAPGVVMMDGEYIDKVRLIHFWSELDAAAKELRSEAIRRLATGLDMPPEVLLGTADMNHWNAWQMEDASIKAHTEPLLALITAGLTIGYLRSVLQVAKDSGGGGLTPEEARAYTVGADTSQMRLRPNRSKEAIELSDRPGMLKDETTRRENGFSEEDKPDDAETLIQFLRKLLANTSGTPDQVSSAMEKMTGFILPTDPTTPELEPGDGEEPGVQTPPTLDQHPRREPPEQSDAQAASLVAASEILVFRALERSGNKVKTRFSSIRPEGVSSCDLYQHVALTPEDATVVLDGAWDNVARFTGSLGVPADRLTDALDSYVRMLFATRAEHDAVVMRRYLALAD